MNRLGTLTVACAPLKLPAPASAWSWDDGTRVTLVTSDGARIVGVGDIDADGLAITVSEAFTGFAVLVLEGPGGTLETFDAVIEEDGTILLGAEEGEFTNLRDSAGSKGLGYRVAYRGGERAPGPARNDDKRRARAMGVPAPGLEVVWDS